MDRSITPPWAPKGFYLCPWGALGRPPPYLARDLHWEIRELGFHKISLVQIFQIHSLPFRHNISHVRTLNNANSVSRLCGTKLSPTLVFIGFLGNEDKIPKTASEDNLSDFRLVCAAGILGAISPSSLTRIGPSTCPNRRYRQGPQLW
jgi:hypothetical protein